MSNRDKMTIRFDWLTFTIPSDAFDCLEKLVGQLFTLSLDCFVDCVGRYGYRRGSYFEHITILQDGARDFMGVCFDISGQGVSYLYSLKNFSFDDLFKLINSLGGNISRLDVALDCFNNELDYDVLYKACADRAYASRWRTCVSHVNHCTGGFDTQFGSRSSDCMLRIYDKKVQSKCSDCDYWCRLEFQFRHAMASAFVDTYLNSINDKREFIELFLGVLTNYLRFVDPIYDKRNLGHCPTVEWWARFIEDVAKS